MVVSSANGESIPIYSHCIAQYRNTKVPSQRKIDESVFLQFSRQMFDLDIPFTKKNIKLALCDLVQNRCFMSCFSKTLPDFLVEGDFSSDVQGDVQRVQRNVERMLHNLLDMNLEISEEVLRLDILRKLIVTSALFPLPDSSEFVDLLHTNLLSKEMIKKDEFRKFYQKITEFYKFVNREDDESENECEVSSEDDEDENECEVSEDDEEFY